MKALTVVSYRPVKTSRRNLLPFYSDFEYVYCYNDNLNNRRFVQRLRPRETHFMNEDHDSLQLTFVKARARQWNHWSGR